jgi:hypothetical protein
MGRFPCKKCDTPKKLKGEYIMGRFPCKKCDTPKKLNSIYLLR